jgi:hypothetical protein
MPLRETLLRFLRAVLCLITQPQRTLALGRSGPPAPGVLSQACIPQDNPRHVAGGRLGPIERQCRRRVLAIPADP